MAVWAISTLTLAHASTILNTGATLAFTISDRSFAIQSTRLEGPAAPIGVLFDFVTAPMSGPTLFDAELESVNGAASVSLGTGLRFAPGRFQGTFYSGGVDVLSGSVTLPIALSEELFAGSQAVLVLRNDGLPLTLGLAPYSTAQELEVSLDGGSFSTGAVVSTRQPLRRMALLAPSNEQPPQLAPEPDYGLACGGIGALFLAVAWGLNRFRGRRI